MGDPLAVLLIAGVHAVRVAVAAPAHGDAEPVQPALELVGVAAPGRARGWREGRSTHLLHLPPGAGNRAGLGHGRRMRDSARQGKGQEHPGVPEGRIWAPREGRGTCRIPCLRAAASARGGGFRLSRQEGGRCWGGPIPCSLPAGAGPGSAQRRTPSSTTAAPPQPGAHPGWCSWRESRRCSPRSRCPRRRSSAPGCSARCCT